MPVSLSKHISYLLITLLFMFSATCWLGWGGRNLYFSLLFPVAIVLLNLEGGIRFVFQRRYVLLFIIIVITNIFYRKGIIVIELINFFNLFLVLSVNDGDKYECFHYLTKVFGFLIIPGVIVYLLWLYVPIPEFGIIKAKTQNFFLREGYGVHYNYIFFSVPVQNFTGFCRFNGMFIEPGHLGSTGAFILFAARFQFAKYKYLWAVLMGVIFSLSLAGYVLTTIGFVFTQYYRGHVKLKSIIIFFLAVYAFCYFGLTYNDGNNLIYERILSRLEYDEDNIIAGNNRLVGDMDFIFPTNFTDLRLFLFGYSREAMLNFAEMGNRGTGIQYSLISHGVVGTVVAFVPYLFFISQTSNKRFAILFLVFVFLCYFQANQSYRLAWIICFVYGIVMCEHNDETESNF